MLTLVRKTPSLDVIAFNLDLFLGFFAPHVLSTNKQSYFVGLDSTHTIALLTKPGLDPSPVPVLLKTGRSGLASPLCRPSCAAPAAPGVPLKFKFPIRLTILLPTASTAPLGLDNVGPLGATFSTLKSLILVPFQTPTVPFWTCISDVNAKDQRRDSYQPRDRGDHSKYWMRMGEGSMPVILAV
jgi:hypothetical protein